MKLKKVLAVISDEITAIQVNNQINQPDMWELEFIQLHPQMIEEILEWHPDLIIFDINSLSTMNGTDYIGILTKNNIPFLFITSSETDTAFIESAGGGKSYNLPDLKDAIHQTLNTALHFN